MYTNEQLDIINHNNGHVRVTAVPGSGKTQIQTLIQNDYLPNYTFDPDKSFLQRNSYLIDNNDMEKIKHYVKGEKLPENQKVKSSRFLYESDINKESTFEV